MMSNNFIVQFFQRLAKKNPKFFNYISVFSLVLFALSWAIGFLQKYPEQIHLPTWTNIISDLTTKLISGTALVMAQLTCADPNNPTK